MDRRRCIMLLCSLVAIQSYSDALPYSHADMGINNYGNFGFPFKQGNNYGLIGGSYSGPPIGAGGPLPPPGYGGGSGLYPAGALQNAYLGGPQAALYPQQSLYGSGIDLNAGPASGYQYYPGAGGQFGGGGIGPALPLSQSPILVHNNNPQIGLGSQFAGSPSFISSSQPAFGQSAQFLGSPSNSFVQSQPGLTLGSQFAGGPSNSFVSNSPSFISTQPIAQPIDNQPLGIVPDIQPNQASFFSPGSSSGQFSSGNSLSSFGGGNVGLGGISSQNSVFSNPSSSGLNLGNGLTSGSNNDIFSSVLHSLGI